MTDFILFMHNDASNENAVVDWDAYLARLRTEGVFQGGSAIGSGQCMRRDGDAPEISDRIIGFIKIQAKDLEHVRQLLIGNPIFEAGGTVEARELPRTD